MDSTSTDAAVRKAISQALADAEILHSNDHVQMIINATNILYDRGFLYGYVDVANFLNNKKSKEVVAELGLTRAIQAITLMKMPSIKKTQQPSRNAQCPCDSGKKFKQCCLNKYQ